MKSLYNCSLVYLLLHVDSGGGGGGVGITEVINIRVLFIISDLLEISHMENKAIST